MDPADIVSMRAETITQLERMATALETGIQRRLPPLWKCAVVADIDRDGFSVSLATAPSLAGDSSAISLPEIRFYHVNDLPMSDFNGYMDREVTAMIVETEVRRDGDVAVKALKSINLPAAKSEYEATGAVRGFLSKGIVERITQRQPAAALPDLRALSKRKVQERAEEAEALRSIQELLDTTQPPTPSSEPDA